MEETIAAIATPLGLGSLAVIRFSGKTALEVADKVFRACHGKPSEYKTHTLHHGRIFDGDLAVDEVLLAIMRAPKSYTTEDVVEISCHGGMVSAKRILDVVLKNGARLAHSGEFTRRAFLNGRIDLTQAEAVLDIIGAQTEGAHTAAVAQLEGHLYRRLEELYDRLSNILAHVEAHIDFPDEDISPANRTRMIEQVRKIMDFQNELLRSERNGRVLREGVRAIIIGKPNVGKSTLLNALVGHDRAIVSAIPGTTRDTIEEVVSIQGFPLRIMDTAGLRNMAEEIEKEGIARTRRHLEAAELVLLVLDASQSLEEMDRELLASCKNKPLVVILNKKDLGQVVNASDLSEMTSCSLSLKTGEGLDSLKEMIANDLWQGKARASFCEVFINARHAQALQRSHQALQKTEEALCQNQSFEYVAADLRVALEILGEIAGHTVTEDVLDRIFSAFCIGK